ncbi:hypothetical protein G436_2665 [Leptospira interrogans serovar Hardjo str. Norma]|uniref:Uncharacterized protein n=1 Tax=Leptospira interrogans serovar Hardjo str. Norma TaxID=1279460 RepID=A0A0M4MV83_LEPIR|nr:hypothetical protein G436_2665 [Leptospira interrogans serovar Hardjo str. Norma]
MNEIRTARKFTNCQIRPNCRNYCILLKISKELSHKIL